MRNAKYALGFWLWGLILLSIVVFVIATASTANAVIRQQLKYGLYLSGFRVGEISLSGVFTDTAYNIRGQMGGAGIGRAFVPARYSGSVSGFMKRRGLQPHEFSGRFDRGQKYFTVDISYKGDRPRVVTIFPEPAKRAYDLNFKQLRKTLDPITAAFTLFNGGKQSELCGRTVDIYEGRRLSRITLGAPVAAEDAGELKCEGVYSRVDGYPPELMKKRVDFPFEMIFAPRTDGTFGVRTFVAQTTFGKAQARIEN